MYRRKLSKTLSCTEVRAFDDAAHFAEARGKPLNTTVTIHPSLLDDRPNDIGLWLPTLLNKLRIWCDRAGFGYFSLWVRENYAGPDREHFHVLLYVPAGRREALLSALVHWLPGKDTAIKMETAKFETSRSGRRVNKALTYVMKQMTTQAWYSLGKKVRREKICRRTGAPVAPVLGKRSGISRSLNATTSAAFWNTPIPIAQSRAAPPRRVRKVA